MNLTNLLAFLDQQPEHEVMSAVAELYKEGGRGLFSERLVGFIDLQILGYQGFRSLLTNLYDVDADFVRSCEPELKRLQQLLGKNQTHKEKYNDGENADTGLAYNF